MEKKFIHVHDLVYFNSNQVSDGHGAAIEVSPSTSIFPTNGLSARPSSKQIWDRINGGMLELHPELAFTKPLTIPQESRPRFKGSSTTLIRHFLPFNSKLVPKAGPLPRTVKTESGQEFLILLHDPSSSLLSVRLPPIHESSLSRSGRMALKKLREEVYFLYDKN